MDYVIGLGRRQRKRQALHQTLLDVAARLFHEQGVGRTTVDDIAEAADVARQTVFNHFPYKEAIALELGSDGLQMIAQRVYALLEVGTPALDVLECTGSWVLETAIDQGELAVVMAQEMLHPDPERAQRAAQLLPLREIIEAILVQAHEEGAIRGDLPLPVVASRICAVWRSVLADVTTETPTQLQRELTVWMDIVFNGIKDRRIR